MADSDTPSPEDQRARFAECMEAIARSRDSNAFQELFTFFSPRLRGYLARLGADETLAEELVQEVMTTVWRKAGQYDRRQASVSTWIFQIARNRRIDAHRRASKPALQPDEPALRPPEPEEPDFLLGRAQTEDLVRAALDELPEEQLSILKAAFYDGLSHSEIADAFGLPLGTVKSRIRLAFNRLRGQLEDET
ncbi:MAG: sigma-70 family RNA polymerase sigma factor [Pseudomonadota bacterium]